MTSDTNALTETSAPPPTIDHAAQRQPWGLGGSSDQPHAKPAAEDDLAPVPAPLPPTQPSTHLPTLYTLSHLIFFSILGTLARLGLQSLTFYPGAPIITGVLWANLSGSLVMGFLLEDRFLFASQENHKAVKKTIPLYIGLTTGFCGSFTSFSSFIRDTFLALTNSLAVPEDTTDAHQSRNGGYSFMATVAVIIVTVAVSLSALLFGSHLALALNHTIPPRVEKPTSNRTRGSSAARTNNLINMLALLLGWGSWIGAVFLALFPPHTYWRGDCVFAIVFAPLGCLLRYYLSRWLNARLPAFPLGTFAVNLVGTVVLAMCFDLQRVEGIAGAVVSCQVLQGVMDGFCGAATTISTWVAELNGLPRRREAYLYGVASVGVALGFFVVIAGSLAWTRGFAEPICS
ncbi:FluC/FEX family fluoride channel [Aspergillus saccharolyticus JOP 1030-1]|uniref:Putative chromosome condensation protein n=1 Tax=Aspergillus saccharolyticus JOP 1030-1 TaxID=1450539 RepID=A0A318ZDM4_9EURO|nr:putative chromosome condensation protein [Aspergillus saccharolyticus JOP 1030-1]PYH41630.1 putative chromosome condensation protein [Aspergillus saccharolyticus JOP 1030-1]